MRRIEVMREGRSWAVKHNGGFLGYAASESEARTLADLLELEGAPQTKRSVALDSTGLHRRSSGVFPKDDATMAA